MDCVIFSIITFMLISVQSTHILVVDASLNEADYFNGHALQGLNYLEDSRDGRENLIEKVTGKEESEGNEILILEKFRALLGLNSFGYSKTPSNGYAEYGSSSPSPLPTIEAEAPAPAPVQPITVHSHHHHHHHQLHRFRPIPQLQKIHKKDGHKGRLKRILLAVLVSAGATIVLCTLGLVWVCRNFRKQRKQSKSSVSTFKSEGGTKGGSMPVNSHKSAEKVSSDPGLELFYIDSLETALEPQPLFLKQNPEEVNSLSNQSTSRCKLNEGERSEQGPGGSESASFNYSAAKEITSVHESAESVKYESDGRNSSSGEKIVPAETQSDDDESFHSFCDSHSSNKRFSNASAGSFSERSEILSPTGSKIAPCSMTSPLYLQSTPACLASFSDSLLMTLPPHEQCNLKQISQSSPSSFNCPKGFTSSWPAPPPPPPPPLPSLRFYISPSHSSSCSTRITSKALSPSTLPVLLSPRNSDSSSGSNQTPPGDLPPSPPNPSRHSGTIPPPPCPPPLFGGNCNSLKGPPPPPSQFPQFKLLGKDGAPLPKLKPLHWDKVRAAPDRSMVWDKLRSSSFEFDEEMIESLFGYNLQNSLKNDDAKSKSPSPSKHVLEPKRLQNLTILSKAVNLTVEQVCDALVQGEGLSLQQLEALVKMVPTKEEEEKLSKYKGDIRELGSAERFVKAMLNIPFAFIRIEAMLYRETFEDEVVHLRKSFLMLQEACEELRSSRLFLKLLEAVLKTGNRMNVGTIRGGARAFKLDALLKLADVKGTDGRTTLLHFVVQEIVRSEGIRVSESIMGKINQRSTSTIAEEREEDYRRMGLDLVSGLGIELCNVKKTATIDLDVLASSVSNLSDGMAKLQHLVGKDLSADENSGNFVHSIRSFLGYAERNIKELEEDEGRVLSHVREITEYFHGNVSKDEANPLRIFVIVRDFLCMLDHVCKELRSSKVPSSPNPLAPFR